MTSQTKLFIELTDLVGWRFECKTCHASLELSLEDFRTGTLNECPQCRAHWASIPSGPSVNTSFEPYFQKFISTLNDLKRELGEKTVLGFSMMLEIKEPPKK